MKYGISYLIAGALCLLIAFASPALSQSTAPSLPEPSPVVAPLVVPVVAPNDFEARVNFIVKCCLAVIGGITTVLGSVAVLWASVKPQLAAIQAKIESITGRLDRQAQKTGSLQEQVTANARALSPASTPPTDSPTTGSPSALLAVLGAFMLFGLSGCATDTGDVKKDRQGRVTNAVLADVFNIVLQGAVNAGVAALQGQNGQDAAEGAFATAALVNGPNIIGHVITAYAGPQSAPIAQAAQQAVAMANPQTPAEKAAVLNTVGAAIQLAANQVAH